MALYEILEKNSPFLDRESYEKLTEQEKEDYPYWVEIFGSDDVSLAKLYFHYIHGEYFAFCLYKNFHHESRKYAPLIKNNIAGFAQSIQSNADHIKHHVQDRRTLELAKKLQNQQTPHFIFVKGVLINVKHITDIHYVYSEGVVIELTNGTKQKFYSLDYYKFTKFLEAHNITISRFEE